MLPDGIRIEGSEDGVAARLIHVLDFAGVPSTTEGRKASWGREKLPFKGSIEANPDRPGELAYAVEISGSEDQVSLSEDLKSVSIQGVGAARIAAVLEESGVFPKDRTDSICSSLRRWESKIAPITCVLEDRCVDAGPATEIVHHCEIRL